MACSLSLGPLASFDRWRGRSTAGPSHYRKSSGPICCDAQQRSFDVVECRPRPLERLMRRRDLITLLGGAAAWPFNARAQQPPQPVIGYLSGGTSKDFARLTAAFRHGLNDSGYVEGRNLAIEYRWAEGQYDRLPALAADLVRRQISLMAATTTPAALAAKGATSTIPIVFSIGADPIAIGLVERLNRPGGNITGVNNYLSNIGAKRLELLRELVPNT